MPFWELSVPASADTAEGLTNFLWEQGALGVVEEEPPGGAPQLRAFFAEAASPAELLAAVRAYREGLERLGFRLPAEPPAAAPVADQAWDTAWRAFFTPVRVGRLVVLPPWLAGRADRPAGLPLVIEPARAFGTGHHGSTAGCLELLAPGPGVAGLDIGCGSGILAIAAVLLGAGRMLAVDLDPDAVAATRRNALLNGCAERIETAVGGPERLGGGPYALVLANLLTAAHLALAPQYRRLVAPGGTLILGGMLAGEEEAVAAALARQGLARRARTEVDGWAALALAAR
jgi:ribosomal protein L11 methyltransferase